MYGWIWSKLPGNWALKTLESVVLVALIAGTLVVVVFPWVEPKLPFSGNTVSGDTEPGDAVTTPSSGTPTPSTTSTTVPKTPSPDTGGDVIPGD